MEIRIDQVGRISAGNDTGNYVKIEDDAENTGGYLILIASQPEMQDGFDNWVENRDALSQYFIETGWVVEWL